MADVAHQDRGIRLFGDLFYAVSGFDKLPTSVRIKTEEQGKREQRVLGVPSALIIARVDQVIICACTGTDHV